MTKSRPRVTPPASSGRSGTGSAREPEGTSMTHAQGTSDAFFRHIVSGMRNGVLAITRDGRLALINDEAYRIFGVAAKTDDVGRPLAVVLKDHPDVVRVLTGAFALHLLRMRVVLRWKRSIKVFGCSVRVVPDERARPRIERRHRRLARAPLGLGRGGDLRSPVGTGAAGL